MEKVDKERMALLRMLYRGAVMSDPRLNSSLLALGDMTRVTGPRGWWYITELGRAELARLEIVEHSEASDV